MHFCVFPPENANRQGISNALNANTAKPMHTQFVNAKGLNVVIYFTSWFSNYRKHFVGVFAHFIINLLSDGRTTNLLLRDTEVNLHCVSAYSGTSLLGSPTGCASDLNGEVTVLQGVLCTLEYNLGLSQGDRNVEVILLVR